MVNEEHIEQALVIAESFVQTQQQINFFANIILPILGVITPVVCLIIGLIWFNKRQIRYTNLFEHRFKCLSSLYSDMVKMDEILDMWLRPTGRSIKGVDKRADTLLYKMKVNCSEHIFFFDASLMNSFSKYLEAVERVCAAQRYRQDGVDPDGLREAKEDIRFYEHEYAKAQCKIAKVLKKMYFAGSK
jgi:hypothetical protein